MLDEAAKGVSAATLNTTVYRGIRMGLLATGSADATATIRARIDCRPVVEQLSGRTAITDACGAAPWRPAAASNFGRAASPSPGRRATAMTAQPP